MGRFVGGGCDGVYAVVLVRISVGVVVVWAEAAWRHQSLVFRRIGACVAIPLLAVTVAVDGGGRWLGLLWAAAF